MIKRKINYKNKARLSPHNKCVNNDFLIPEKWCDFASLCKIRSGDQIINFIPYDYQKILIEQIEKHQTTIIAKTRQLGITETIINYFLHKAIRNEGYLGVIFSKTQSDTSNIAKRLRRQLDYLTDYCQLKSDSLTDIEFLNGGRLLFRNSTPNGARGLESVSDVLFDESGFVDDIEEIYKSTIPCLTVTGKKAKVIILSTPNGQKGFYYDKLSSNNGDKNILEICDLIKEEKLPPIYYFTDNYNNLKFIIHWLGHPKFKLQKDTYLDDIKRQFDLTEEIVNQEYNLSFISSESMIFNVSLIKENAIGKKEEKPINNVKYYFGLDCASLGNDYTVLTVLKEENNNYSLVNYYRKRQQTSEYNIFKISEMIELYKPQKIGIEVNSIGQIYYEQLTNLYKNYTFESIKTTQDSKLVMINRLILALEKKQLIYPNDNVIIDEFLSFRRKGDKLQAINNKHDDIIMSLCFCLTVTPFKPINKKSSFNYSTIQVYDNE